jgi:SPOR domain
MRTLFLLLLLANLGFFAWVRNFGGDGEQRDLRAPQQQIAADQVRILSTRELGAPEPAKTEAPKPEAPRPAAQAEQRACVEWGSFTVTDMARAEKALEPLALGARVAQRRIEETAGWWVYIAPQANRQSAAKKTLELKSIGIEDYFVVLEEGRWRWAISLGVFKSEEAANSRLAMLRAAGVRTALLGQRDTQVQKVLFQVRGVDAAVAARLAELVQAFPGSELKDCPAPDAPRASG